MVINNLKTNKATGVDKIPSRLVKEATPIIATSLCNNFQNSLFMRQHKANQFHDGDFYLNEHGILYIVLFYLAIENNQ